MLSNHDPVMGMLDCLTVHNLALSLTNALILKVHALTLTCTQRVEVQSGLPLSVSAVFE
jgi:hypothetical protein